MQSMREQEKEPGVVGKKRGRKNDGNDGNHHELEEDVSDPVSAGSADLDDKLKKPKTDKEQGDKAAAKTLLKADCYLVAYSNKAFAVFGDTKAIKDQLMALKGRYNKSLKDPTKGDAQGSGWIFQNKDKDNVLKQLALPQKGQGQGSSEGKEEEAETQSDDGEE